MHLYMFLANSIYQDKNANKYSHWKKYELYSIHVRPGLEAPSSAFTSELMELKCLLINHHHHLEKLGTNNHFLYDQPQAVFLI
jgi:hypothetical protein